MTRREFVTPGRGPIFQFDALDPECRMRRAWEIAMIESRAEFFRSLGIAPILVRPMRNKIHIPARTQQSYASYDGRRAA